MVKVDLPGPKNLTKNLRIPSFKKYEKFTVVAIANLVSRTSPFNKKEDTKKRENIYSCHCYCPRYALLNAKVTIIFFSRAGLIFFLLRVSI